LNLDHKSGAQSQLSKQWEGQIVDGLFHLRQYLGGGETGAVYLTEFEGQRAAIKVVTAVGRSAEQRLWHWRLASKVNHPHLIRLFKVGRSQLGDTEVAYVVMEYAEENLGQVLAERPLAPLEAKEMLGPTLDALACVHRDGFVHGRLKPANIMAVDDCLKLSSDSLRRLGDSDDVPAPQGAYRSPEVAAGGKLSSAADIWALGATLVEVLTQHQPAWTGTENGLALPDGITEPFLNIVRHCLRPYPQERWTAAEIAALLEAPAPTPKKSRSWLYAVPAAVVVVLAVWMAIRSSDTTGAMPASPSASSNAESSPASQPASSLPPSGAAAPPASAVQSPQAPSQPVSTPSVSQPAGGAPTSEPLASRKSTSPPPSSQAPSAAPSSPASGISPPPALTAPTAEPTSPVAAAEPLSTTTKATDSAGNASPEVLNQVMPDVQAKARRSIQGKVTVGVRVHADAYGAVRQATLGTPPASRYFSDLALKAVRRWKFRPVREGEVFVPQEWIVRFEFTREDTKVAVERAAP